ncbi:MAG TPA: type III-A CRISPR-associated protein Csm2 [Planctomycetaceae bacterium]|nr:type III-A CRISPR-associated protein Csm2 [Planctomycetaceae bacterium]
MNDRYHRQANRHSAQTQSPVFDPQKSHTELLDTLAEQQAKDLSEINSNQLRRFFGEVKELYRRFESRIAGQPEDSEKIYRQEIEPLFKMIRSKVSYASRAGGQAKVPWDFEKFLSDGIAKVRGPDDFRLFVRHFEAVVGFLYGLDKVQK